jgi:hypothetical protein
VWTGSEYRETLWRRSIHGASFRDLSVAAVINLQYYYYITSYNIHDNEDSYCGDFWVMKTYSLVAGYQRLGRIFWLNLQGTGGSRFPKKLVPYIQLHGVTPHNILILRNNLLLNLREIFWQYGWKPSVWIYFVCLGALRRFNELKQISPSTKTLVAIGGWNAGSYTFSQVSGLF